MRLASDQTALPPNGQFIFARTLRIDVGKMIAVNTFSIQNVLSQQVLHDMSMDIGQAVITALKTEG